MSPSGLRLKKTVVDTPVQSHVLARWPANETIALIFDDIAELLAVQGANPFRIRAYHNAARTLRGLTFELAKLIAQGKQPAKLRGIGKDLLGKIQEITTTGDCALHQRLRESMPGLVQLLAIPGLGARRVQHLYQELGIQTLAQLREAARNGRIRQLRGFGEQMETHLLKATQGAVGEQRLPLARVMPLARRLCEYLQQFPGVRSATVAGSLRRMRDTIGDIDLLVTAPPAIEVMAHFLRYPAIKTVLQQGSTRASVILDDGLQVDLRLVDPAVEGAALVYFTGSKAHNITLRLRAKKQDLKLSEYGLFKGRECLASASEAQVYQALGLPWIAPELREDRGEILAAQKGQLPCLIEPGDLKGDLHAHTPPGGGPRALEDMALAARAAGLEYLAITDDSAFLQSGQGPELERLEQQIERIDAINRRLSGITLLKGLEVEILEDGRLDVPDSLLAHLDLVVGVVRKHFALPSPQQTRRLLRAMEHQYFTVLAHPLCRLINERGPLALDFPAVVKAAAQRGCCLELNAQPQRMDLFDLQCQYARDHGVLISISADARSGEDFDYLPYGIGQARRAWLEKSQVLNTRSLTQLGDYLRTVHGKA
ncbi:DNA polymerase/3'-5' exonuclease PolX [Pseudomonas sp. MWU13-2105]|uniref:DNA polymerase/3'-5' exonuclease PolX n=1 Tax=Pseudomonas sp. MWU13-2105 TaxID=2935074 RepID=UPI00200DDFBB|nr:DNA polymerase/3'-5' exonuclease PolX [Pseudomonas sp. MWU13-2105]